MSEKTATTPTASAARSGRVRFGGVSFDCADPAGLARFYGAVLDLPVLFASDDFVALGHAGQPAIGFARVPGYQRPTWPEADVPKQAHLDLGVDDLDTAQTELLALGATAPPAQPQPDQWRVLIDPAGHPFCISTRI
jgi:hypothetical protein